MRRRDVDSRHRGSGAQLGVCPSDAGCSGRRASRPARAVAASSRPPRGKVRGFLDDGIRVVQGRALRRRHGDAALPAAGAADAVDRRPRRASSSVRSRRSPGMRGVPMSEDCLHLNVWTPALDAARRPVMVWFHPGAFSSGTSNELEADGARLAAAATSSSSPSTTA